MEQFSRSLNEKKCLFAEKNAKKFTHGGNKEDVSGLNSEKRFFFNPLNHPQTGDFKTIITVRLRPIYQKLFSGTTNDVF